MWFGESGGMVCVCVCVCVRARARARVCVCMYWSCGLWTYICDFTPHSEWNKMTVSAARLTAGISLLGTVQRWVYSYPFLHLSGSRCPPVGQPLQRQLGVNTKYLFSLSLCVSSVCPFACLSVCLSLIGSQSVLLLLFYM